MMVQGVDKTVLDGKVRAATSDPVPEARGPQGNPSNEESKLSI